MLHDLCALPDIIKVTKRKKTSSEGYVERMELRKTPKGKIQLGIPRRT
jgi:hypothetical protein